MLTEWRAQARAAILPRTFQADQGNMSENIARANDVVLAEAVVFALAQAMPRAQKRKNSVKKAVGQSPWVRKAKQLS